MNDKNCFFKTSYRLMRLCNRSFSLPFFGYTEGPRGFETKIRFFEFFCNLEAKLEKYRKG